MPTKLLLFACSVGAVVATCLPVLAAIKSCVYWGVVEPWLGACVAAWLIGSWLACAALGYWHRVTA